MEKLKKIINQIETDNCLEFESLLKGNNSAKFLLLFKSYQEAVLSDEEIKEKLKCNDNALYVLKSRLYDKIQKFLLEKKGSGNTETMGSDNLSQYLYEYPRETAIAILSEMESKYLAADAADGLINVYSALKKAHYYSDKYYTYSQLYNKQVAYTMALEKAEDALSNFNRTLANFYFSSSDQDLQVLKLLRSEIKNIWALNKSFRIELIMNIISIQTILFTDIDLKEEEPIEDLLEKCDKILQQFKEDRKSSYHRLIIDFLNFEYYFKINQLKKAQSYFERVNAYSQKWLLQNNSCLAFRFLLSKVELLLRTGKKDQIGDDAEAMYFDPQDLYTSVIFRFYLGISHYFKGKIKSSINILNDILNEVSFKNYFHIETDIKLTLAYLYIQQKDLDMAENLLKSLTRKLAGLKVTNLRNVKEAIKIFTLMMNDSGSSSGRAKIQKSIEQFNFYNFSEKKILAHLNEELNTLAGSN